MITTYSSPQINFCLNVFQQTVNLDLSGVVFTFYAFGIGMGYTVGADPPQHQAELAEPPQ